MKERVERKDELTNLYLYQACLIIEEVNRLVEIRGYSKLGANGWEAYIKRQVNSLVEHR